jgi:hypothetical protein
MFFGDVFDPFFDITEIYKSSTNQIHIGRLGGLFLDSVIELGSSILVVLHIWI